MFWGFHPGADGANTYRKPDNGIKATARIRVLGIELRDNSDGDAMTLTLANRVDAVP